MDRIRVLLADDHEVMLERVAGLLSAECDVVGTVTDGQQALAAARELKPDVLVLDISMPVPPRKPTPGKPTKTFCCPRIH